MVLGQAKPLGPFEFETPDGQRWIIGNVNVFRMDPDVIEMVARRTAYLMLSTQHGSEKAAAMLDRVIERDRTKARERAIAQD